MRPYTSHYMLENQTSPDYKPADAQIRQEHADMAQCEKYALPNFFQFSIQYMDRVGPELFVTRTFNPGNCSAMAGKFERRLFPSGMYSTDNGYVRYKEQSKYGRGSQIGIDPHVPQLKHNMHSYVVAITPDKVECNCIYCGSNIQYTPEDFEEGSGKDVIGRLKKMTPKSICWDEPWSKPRRATQRELDSMGFTISQYTNIEGEKVPSLPIDEDKAAYLDHIYNGYMARVRCGKCPEGGQHDAILFYADEDMRTYPITSYCIFCREEWIGPPDGFENTFRSHVYDGIYLDLECARLRGGDPDLSVEEIQSNSYPIKDPLVKNGDITVEQARAHHAKAKALGIF